MKNKKYYTNCSELPIYNFFEFAETKDSNFLKVNKKNEVGGDKLAKAAFDILCEYNALTDNKKLIKKYKEQINVEYLEAKYYAAKKILSLYIDTLDINVLLLIKEFGFPIDTAKLIMPQIKRISRSLLGIKNRLKIHKVKLEKINLKTLKEVDDSKGDIEKNCMYLEAGIPLSYRIDIYKDSIKKYIYWNQILESKNPKQ